MEAIYTYTTANDENIVLVVEAIYILYIPPRGGNIHIFHQVEAIYIPVGESNTYKYIQLVQIVATI
jgi:hypothetical protein